MIVLTSTDTLTVKLSAPPTSANPYFAGAYVDSTIAGGVTVDSSIAATQLNGATPVTVVAAPASGTTRHLSSFSLTNTDTGAITLSLVFDSQTLITFVLSIGDVLQYSKAQDQFTVTGSTGGIKNTFTYPTGTTSAAGLLQLDSGNPVASSYGGAAAAGAVGKASDSGHKHALPALPTATTSTAGIIQIASANPAAESYGATAVAGSSGLASDRDHVHALPSLPSASTSAAGIIQVYNSTPAVNTYAGAAGFSVQASPGDHAHQAGLATGLYVNSGSNNVTTTAAAAPTTAGQILATTAAGTAAFLVAPTAGEQGLVSTAANTIAWVIQEAGTVAATGGINTVDTIITPAFQVPAGVMVAGCAYRIKIVGTCTPTAGNLSTFTVRIGTANSTSDTTLMTITATSATSGSSVPFYAEIIVIVRTLNSSSGNVIASGVLTNTGTTGINTTATPVFVLGTVVTSINTTTAANYISCSYKSAASTTTSTFQMVTVEQLG